MPRKRAPGFEAQREDILAAAARLFAEQGFSATSMNQVAEACGVAKPTLYHYFQDKQALLAQICDSHVHLLLALVQEVKAQQLPPAEQLRLLIERFTRVYAGAQAQHRVLTSEIRFLAEAERERLLDAAAREGMDVPFSCKSGVCSTCRCKLVEGEVRMDKNFALDKDEVAAGFILSCQAHPLTEQVVISFDER